MVCLKQNLRRLWLPQNPLFCTTILGSVEGGGGGPWGQVLARSSPCNWYLKGRARVTELINSLAFANAPFVVTPFCLNNCITAWIKGVPRNGSKIHTLKAHASPAQSMEPRAIITIDNKCVGAKPPQVASLRSHIFIFWRYNVYHSDYPCTWVTNFIVKPLFGKPVRDIPVIQPSSLNNRCCVRHKPLSVAQGSKMRRHTKLSKMTHGNSSFRKFHFPHYTI